MITFFWKEIHKYICEYVKLCEPENRSQDSQTIQFHKCTNPLILTQLLAPISSKQERGKPLDFTPKHIEQIGIDSAK